MNHIAHLVLTASLSAAGCVTQRPAPRKMESLAQASRPAGVASAPTALASAPTAPASSAPADRAQPATPAVELSAGGAQLVLSRFEPSVAISIDGARLGLILAGPVDGGVALLLDTVTGRTLQRWVPPGGTGWGAGFRTLQFLPDGRLLAVDRARLYLLSDDGGARALWPANIAWASPDGAWIVSVAENEVTIRPVDGAPVVLLRRPGRLQTIAFTADGTRLALVRSEASDDIPLGDTQIVLFDRRGARWVRSREHAFPGARQENDAAFLSRDVLLLDDSLIDLQSGARTPSGAPGLNAVSSDAMTLLLTPNDGTAQVARILDGRLGPAVEALRPEPFTERGIPVAVSSLGQVLWCTGSACGFGPAAGAVAAGAP